MQPVCLCWTRFLPCFTDSQCDHYVATKQDFVVPLEAKLNDSLQLKWRHGQKTIFERRATDVLVGKADDVYHNGSLRLRNVDMSKAGKYIPLIYYRGSAVGSPKAIELCVIGRLQICLDFGYKNLATN